jgi:hypothetical protein
MIDPTRPSCNRENAAMRRLILLVSCLFAAPLLAGASPPPVQFRLADEAALPVARLCERVWQERGTALAEAILPAGAPIDTVVCLVLPSAEFAGFFQRSIPDWGVGVAMPGGRVIALDHERLPTTGPGPEAVFMHEMAHALLFQAAGESRLPTWLHEGVAMQASGEWRFSDTVGVILEGHLPSLASLDGPFPRHAGAADRAYRTSLLAVNWLEGQHGPQAVRRVVAASRRLGDFEAGFTAATGEQPDQFASRFAGAMRLRFGWVLLIFRWPTLFVIMALVFTAGALRKIILGRRRDLDDDRTDPA